MKRQTLLVTLAVASVLLASLLMFIFNDGKPRFLTGREGKVELVRNNYYILPPPNEVYEMREWRVWPARFEELAEAAKQAYPGTDGYTYTEQKIDDLPWLQISGSRGMLTIYFERGDWHVFQTRKVSKLDYYRAWIRSGGKLEPEMPTVVRGASPKAGSPSKSP